MDKALGAGDRSREQIFDRLVRVDHAGEYGAVRIYQGQLAILGHGPQGAAIRHMLDQEKVHRQFFEDTMAAQQSRPTALQPLWHVAGWLLGAGTALLGERAAMACTVAVEETIDAHYSAQIASLGEDHAGLSDRLITFRAEELEHRDLAYEQGAEQAVAYPVLTAAIKTGAKLAIWLSERV